MPRKKKRVQTTLGLVQRTRGYDKRVENALPDDLAAEYKRRAHARGAVRVTEQEYDHDGASGGQARMNICSFKEVQAVTGTAKFSPTPKAEWTIDTVYIDVLVAGALSRGCTLESMTIGGQPLIIEPVAVDLLNTDGRIALELDQEFDFSPNGATLEVQVATTADASTIVLSLGGTRHTGGCA